MPPNIMVVDDEQNIRDIIGELLTDSGYHVTLAVDGVDALEKTQFVKYDLFIVDVYMPRMDGLEFLSKIKEVFPLAVVIITTGFSSIETAIRAIRIGAFHYITKPIQIDELISVVESGLEHNRALGELPQLTGSQADGQLENTEISLLRGFNKTQQLEFFATSKIMYYKPGEEVILDDALGTIIWIEAGSASVYLNSAMVDNIKGGDVWGEETFFSSTATPTQIRSAEASTIRHFHRKKLIEYFTYQDETLIKKFMINLLHCSYIKWRRSIYRISLFHGFVPPIER